MFYRSPMFTLVKEMNEAFGNAEGDPADYAPMPDAGKPGERHFNAVAWGRLTNQCKNIAGDDKAVNGECRELLDALEMCDLDKTRDALCDIMVFALGAYHMLGYDADADMGAVIDGVMTRFCKDESEAGATVNLWSSRGVTKIAAYGAFPRVCIKATEDQVSNSGEFIPKGKFLRSVGYREPVLPLPPVKLHARQYIGMAREGGAE